MSMARMSIMTAFTALFLLSSSSVFAQETADPCGCGDKSSEKIEDCVKDESLATWVIESEIVYETEDGNLYWWLDAYNEAARGLFTAGDEEGLKEYIREIAGNYRFGSGSDEEGFIGWALETRPWEKR
ncbi:MAG: hypothetical protein JXQ30_10360 [Spirochaetes bacterium]|nr:hypothetical protein [Spirochaetota bacterium]